MASGRGASQKRWRRRGGQRKELLIVNRRVAKKAKPKEKKKRKERDVVEATSEEEGGNRIRALEEDGRGGGALPCLPRPCIVAIFPVDVLPLIYNHSILSQKRIKQSIPIIIAPSGF